VKVSVARSRWSCLVLLLTLGASWRTEAQLDPEKRRLLEFGYNQPIEGRGPIGGYAYYYLNDPGFLRTNLTLRLAIAPIYLDSELGIRDALGAHTDLGVGLSGGGFADSFFELQRGTLLREESFTGHGGEADISLYHLFNPEDRIPLNGILRLGVHRSFYTRDSDTAPNFVLPDDQTTFHIRTGVRYGGREPLMMPALAMELSLWYEGQIRLEPGSYGYNGDRQVEENSHQFWGRALLAYTLPKLEHNFSISFTAGTSLNADRLSAYRLGGALPMVSEFPLSLPGYYFQELTARQFALLDAQYSVPLTAAKTWSVIGYGGTALVDYLPGLEQPGRWNSGVGGGITYQSPSRAWTVMLGYGYGINAIRSHGRGANTIGLLLQYDLEARYRNNAESSRPPLNPGKFRGFDWLLGR
jgi:hypothetical protein